MKITLHLNELLEEKFKRLAQCEGQSENLQGYAAVLLEEAIDLALEDYPQDDLDDLLDDLEEFAA